MIQGDMKNREIRIHPNQKPVYVYKWLLNRFSNEGDKILDTHAGSFNIAKACHDLKRELTAGDIDKHYYNLGIKSLTEHTSQQSLF